MPRMALLSVALSAALAMAASVAMAGIPDGGEPPTIAHVHLGHTLDGWSEAPGQRGLLATAEVEARIATEHAGYAVDGAANISVLKAHVGHVLHAVDPTAMADGPGLGFGLHRAATEAAKHLRFAAESRDASDNLRAAVPSLAAQGDDIAARGAVIVVLARQVLASRFADEAVALTLEISSLSQANTLALAEMGRTLTSTLAGESPPYATVEPRWLFDLVRQPSGDWQFKTPQNQGLPTGY